MVKESGTKHRFFEMHSDGDLLTIPNVMMGVATDQLNASANEIQQLKQRNTNRLLDLLKFIKMPPPTQQQQR